MCDLNQKLLQILQCNICYNYMQDPIHFCSRGHNSCYDCVKKYVQCQICKHPFLTTRNIALETLAHEARIKCDNCELSYSINTFRAHQERCKAKLYRCKKVIIAEDYLKRICKWSGCIEDVFNHFKLEHKGSLFELGVSKRFKWKLPFQQNQFDISIIQLRDTKYGFLVYYEFAERCLCFVVANLEDDRVESGRDLNSVFEVEINQGDDKRVFKGVIQDRICEVSDLNQSDKWLKIHLDDFCHFNIENRNIEWFLTII